MRHPRILLLCPTLDGAGVERRVYLMFNRLYKQWDNIKIGLLRERGEFLTQISKTQRLYVKPGLLSKIVFYPIQNNNDLHNMMLAIGQTRRLVNHFQPQLIVTFTLEASVPLYFARLFGAGKSAIWVISEDSNTAIASKNEFESAIANRLLQAFIGHVYRKADFITTVSTSVQQSINSIYRIPLQRTNVIVNPVDFQSIQSMASQQRPVSFTYIVAVGRLAKVKQFDLLITAFSRLTAATSIHLVILGEGNQRQNLEQLVTELNLEDRVHLPGFTENPWVYMKYAKMLVLSSETEGFGNVLIEAMATGCPVISTNCGGPSDIIEHGKNGLIVEATQQTITDAMQQILDHPKLAATLTKQAHIDVQRFNLVHCTSEFNALLQQLLNNRTTINPGLIS
ncbi:MAG: glycosyltransferase [Gammaproteobacteria bacterium]|nr:glycosyltransferase [Gammaproteobacteria bacterium]